ncbi:MAG: phospho-N-acetylmuramoyl-pentapeptide-transferase [Planctomycetota bacterium]|jgi:phospho-N-acetylmuramoyl-pentapeptide-transferase|nr:phospho-N-acetylmuramoyl-pentapeptide-transferase [Planctomycetota bacterium]
MFRYFAEFSLSHWSALEMFNSITLRSLLALLAAFIAALFFLPRLIRFLTARRALEDMRKDSVLIERRHADKKGTATMGGIGIALALLLGAFFFGDLREPLIWGGLAIFAGNALVGFADDLVKLKKWRAGGLNKKEKTAGLLLVAFLTAAIVATSADANTTKLLLPWTAPAAMGDLGGYYWLWFVLVLYACANAVNLTDGLDGLAAGCALSSVLAFAVFAYVAGNAVLSGYFAVPNIEGCGEMCVLLAGLVGALLGFLWFNAKPAQIFMGDTGALAIGGLLGYAALVSKQEIALLVAGGIFVLETLATVAQIVGYRGWGKRLFLCAPLHHHLELRGWQENHIVIRFWMLNALFAAAALGTLKMH